MRVLALLVVLFVCALPAAAGDAAKARGELIQRLLALATWCNEKELFLQRDNVWRSVLVLEPENVDARKGLRYSRDGQGNWKDPAPREVKDRAPALLPEFGKRRSETVATFRDELLRLLDEQHADAKAREATYAEILGVDPDDARIRELRGEARQENAWVLQETVAGKARRAEIRATIDAAKAEAVKPENLAPSTQDLGFLPAWKLSWSAEGLRLLLQTSEAEGNDLVRTAHAARALLRKLTGKEAELPANFSAYVLSEAADRDKFAAALTDVPEADRKIWKESSGAGIPGKEAVVLWHKDAKRRLDCFARHVLAGALLQGFGIDVRQGWVFEGLGLYLSRELVGTRFTWFILAGGGELEKLKTKLLAPESNWMAETLKLYKGSTPPKLAEALPKALSAMKLDELLASYCFSAYLVEGLPAEFPLILERVGKGEAPLDVIVSATHRPFPEVEARFVRWLEERR